MAKVTMQVDRDPSKQPTWVCNYFESFKDLGNAQYIYSLNRSFGGKHLEPTDIQLMMLQSIIDDLPPFIPPVTLRYTDQQWEFSWASDAEQTMFILKLA